MSLFLGPAGWDFSIESKPFFEVSKINSIESKRVNLPEKVFVRDK